MVLGMYETIESLLNDHPELSEKKSSLELILGLYARWFGPHTTIKVIVAISTLEFSPYLTATEPAMDLFRGKNRNGTKKLLPNEIEPEQLAAEILNNASFSLGHGLTNVELKRYVIHQLSMPRRAH